MDEPKRRLRQAEEAVLETSEEWMLNPLGLGEKKRLEAAVARLWLSRKEYAVWEKARMRLSEKKCRLNKKAEE